jgi:hypothetical protein
MTRPFQHLTRAAVALAVLCAVFTPAWAGEPNAEFKAENDAAMNRMMAAMAIKPSGDVDRDFAEMMIPHHQGAIDMAEAELRHGRNEQLRRIAQEIIVDQLQEIAAMRLALGDRLPTPAPAPTQPTASAPTPDRQPTPMHSEHRQ